MNNPYDPVLLNKKQVAARLGVGIRTVENWQSRGVLPYIKVGKIVRFHWSDVMDRLNSNFKVKRKT